MLQEHLFKISHFIYFYNLVWIKESIAPPCTGATSLLDGALLWFYTIVWQATAFNVVIILDLVRYCIELARFPNLLGCLHKRGGEPDSP